MSEKIENIIIIGTGAAGLTAAIYAARANMQPLVLAGLQPGGQLTITSDVENYPGFADIVGGPWLMEQMQAQAEKVGARIEYDLATSVDLSGEVFVINCDSGKRLIARSVIIATGAQARWLGLESEQKFNGRGVSACATCDGFFYRGKDVGVVGGGNTAVEEALYLSNICKSVTLIHRRDSLRAEQIMQDRLMQKSNIRIIWNSEVDEIMGDDSGVTGLMLKSGGETSRIGLDGVFIAIGHDPATAAFKGLVAMDSEGYILADAGSTRTSVEGIFAAGDCVDKVYRQAVTAAGMGCMAALDAERWLANKT